MLLCGLLALPGCAPAVEPLGTPIPDPGPVAARVAAGTRPVSPQQATFAWQLDESGSRAGGRGVVRYVAPERIRLDLFGPRGETYLAAALVGDEYRLPPAASAQLTLPSPALLWSALGVLRPPAGAQLLGATREDSVVTLRYALEPGVELRAIAELSGGGARLRSVERIGRSGVLESVQLEYAPAGALSRTRYRDWSAYRDLVLDLETIKDVPQFPGEIWSPGAPSR